MRLVGLSRLLGPTTRGRPLSLASAPLGARTPVRAVSQASMSSSSITYLSQDQAIKVDEDLMGPLGFSVDQLMELAGLSVASSLAEVYSRADHSRVLVFAGPGNNGGDGLVAARHLHHFGYRVKICYPKRTDRQLYRNLVKQCECLDEAMFVDDVESALSTELAQCDVVLDAIFGFSFRGEAREPFKSVLSALQRSEKPIVSVDIPSGWDVEKGAPSHESLDPDMLVSLTAPKQCALGFKGSHHYLGGRFVPPEITQKYHLVLPSYEGSKQCVRIE